MSEAAMDRQPKADLKSGTDENAYRWHWRVRPEGRKDQRLRVVCRGTMNSALVEFEDGYRCVVSRNGLRRWRS